MTSTITNRSDIAPEEGIKAPCKLATTANITLSGHQTIDGTLTVEDDRILVKNQTAGAENGIYLAKSSTWVRTPDFNDNTDISSGQLVAVDLGSVGSGIYQLTYTGAIDLGTTSLTFERKLSVTSADITNNTYLHATLTSSGTDTYTANLTNAPSAYATGQKYTFIADVANTGACTIDFNSLGAKSIKLADGNDPHDGAIQANAPVNVQYDGTNFVLLNPYPFDRDVKGADVASAAALPLLDDGYYNDVTGTTTVTSFNSVYVGAIKKLHFDAALILTHHATDLILPDGVNITTYAGYEAEFIEYATGDWRMLSSNREKGSVVQIVNTQDGAVNTGTTVMAFDDTIPQNTEGDEYMTLAITPTNANNILIIEAVLNVTHSSASATAMVAGLFQDSTADALSTAWAAKSAAVNTVSQIYLKHYMTAGTASSTTFKIRAGATVAGTTTLNGYASGRLYGGVLLSSITITEVKA